MQRSGRASGSIAPARNRYEMLEQGQKTAAGRPPHAAERLGSYELLAWLGAGRIAEVHLARRTVGIREVVAVKKIHAHLAEQKEFIGALLDDVRAAALLVHSRAMRIHEVGVSGGTYFIAVEYLAGRTLQALLARPADGLGIAGAARIVADAAEALHAGHELRSLSGRPLQLVHAEVSPANIAILYDGSVKLVDFGLARARSWIGREAGGSGSRYASPEQMVGHPVDRRSDVFSLGVVLWEALALRRFSVRAQEGRLEQIRQGAPPPRSAHRTAVPPPLDRICRRALAFDPDQRFQSAAEMQVALESFLDGAGFRREVMVRFMDDRFAAERAASDEFVRAAHALSLAQGLPAPPRRTAAGTGGIDEPDAEDEPTPADPRPRGKGRPERTASAPDVWSEQGDQGDQAGAPSATRALPLPPPPSAEPRLELVTEPDDEDDFTIVEPDKSSRSFEGVRGPARDQRAQRTLLVTPRRSRASWLAAAVAPIAVGVMCAVVYDFVTGAPPETAARRAIPPETPAKVAKAVEPTAPVEPAAPVEPVASAAPRAPAEADVASPAPVAETPIARTVRSKPRTRSARLRRIVHKTLRSPPAVDPAEVYREGARHYLADRLEDARRAFQRAIDAAPGFAPAYRGLGLVHERSGQAERAARAYENYLRLAPSARDADAVRTRLERLQL